MRNTLMLIALSSGLLAGCTAPLLQDMNASLKSVNTSLRGVNDSLRGASGTPATVAASASDACDPTAFKAGFQDQYVINWNLEIGRKEDLYQLLSKQHPEDTAARQNYALYQGKSLNGKGIGNATEYRLRFDSQGHILNDCQARSYTQGGSAGLRAVAQDIQALESQEI